MRGGYCFCILSDGIATSLHEIDLLAVPENIPQLRFHLSGFSIMTMRLARPFHPYHPLSPRFNSPYPRRRHRMGSHPPGLFTRFTDWLYGRRMRMRRRSNISLPMGI